MEFAKKAIHKIINSATFTVSGMLILLMVYLMFFGGCRERDAIGVSLQADREALSFYHSGMYRHSADILNSKRKLNVLEQYLLGRNYYELREYQNAVEAFMNVELLEIDDWSQYKFFVENYAYYFSDALISCTNVYTNAVLIISNLLANIPRDSVYYDDVFDSYIYFLWRDNYLERLTNLIADDKKIGDERTAHLYGNMANFLLGDKERLPNILKVYTRAPHKSAYNLIITNIDPSELKTSAQFSSVIDIAVDRKEFEIAEKFLKAHLNKFNDKDFYNRNLAIIEYEKGNRNDAVNGLLAFTRSDNASRITYRRLLDYLYRTRRYNEALDTVKTLRARYPGTYDRDYFRALTLSDNTVELRNWYMRNRGNYTFNRRYADGVIRHLLQNKDNYARQLVSRQLKSEMDHSVLLISALLNYEDGKKKVAYSEFLTIVLDYPFTYEWLVAKRYESELRDKYRDIYDYRLKERVETLPKRPLKMRFYYYLGIEAMDKEFFDNNLVDSFEKVRDEYHSVIMPYFTLKPEEEIKEIAEITNRASFYWNKEIFNYMETAVRNVSTNRAGRLNTRLRAKYTYHYRDIYKALDHNGLVVARLNSYFSDIVGGRRYHFLIPQEILKEAYPLLEFDTVNEIIKNTNNTMWVISAFREESHFRKYVTSWVGAVGYAQVMPYTANTIKERINRPELHNRDFADNVLMGTTLFRWLFQKYRDNYPYVLGAYNAGETAVNRWRRNYKYDTELWIDCVPFTETRNYTKRIMVTRMFYDRLYGMGDFEYATFGW
jgi:hypothetical protein